MTHEIGHIWCGGGGSQIGERTITIYDHSVLNVAIFLKTNSPEIDTPKKRKAIEKLEARIEADRHKWKEMLEKAGIPYTYHQPHAGNTEHD